MCKGHTDATSSTCAEWASQQSAGWHVPLLWHEPVVNTVCEWSSCDSSASIKERHAIRLEFLANQFSNGFKAIWTLSNGILSKNESIQQAKVSLKGMEAKSPSHGAILPNLPTFWEEGLTQIPKTTCNFDSDTCFFLDNFRSWSWSMASLGSVPLGSQNWEFWIWLIALMINNSSTVYMFTVPFLYAMLLLSDFAPLSLPCPICHV